MPIQDNTKSIGRQYDGPNAIVAALDTERSRAAFRQRVKARESKALELKEYCYRYVYRWTLEEKLSIINSYGEISLVQNRNDDNEVTNQLVETLLINLSDKELNQIIADVNKNTIELQQKMKTFSKNADARGKLNSSQSAVNLYRQNAGTSRNGRMGSAFGASGPGQDYGEEMRKQDISFTPSKFSGKIAMILNKELIVILKSYQMKDLISLARKLQISLTGNLSPEDLRQEIINLAQIYVTAITGEGAQGKIVNVPISDQSALDTLDDLIGQTSYAWVVGKPQLSQAALAALRKKAKKKQAEFKERQKFIETEIKKSTYGSEEFGRIAGVKGSRRSVERQLEQNDTGFLKDYTFEQLAQKAAEIGLDIDPRKISVGELKAAIYAKFAENQKREYELQQKLKRSQESDRKLRLRNKLGTGQSSSATREIQQQLDASRSIAKSLKTTAGEMPGASTIASGSGATPLVQFEDGKILTRNITSAVPVFIVGQTNAEELFKQGKEEAKIAAQKAKSEAMTYAGFGAVGPLGKTKISKGNLKKFAKQKQALDKEKEKKYEELVKYADDLISRVKKRTKKLDPSSQVVQEGELILQHAAEVYKAYYERINSSPDKQSLDFLIGKYKDSLIDESVTGLAKPTDFNPIWKISSVTPGQSSSATKITGTFDPRYQTRTKGDPFKGGLGYGQNPNSPGETGTTLDKLARGSRGKWGFANIAKADPRNRGGLNSSSVWDQVDLSDPNWGKNTAISGTNGEEAGDTLFFHTAAKKMFKNYGIKREPVTPVYLVNGFTEYLNNTIEEGLNKVIASNGSIYQYLSAQLPVLFSGLQQAGTAVNIASPTAAMSKVLDLIEQAADSAMIAIGAGSKSSVYKYATGGTGQAVNYSQFVSGDSKTSRPNPELVTVDWDNRQFNVKPANNQGNSVTNKTEMSVAERGSSFNVKFSEGTIKYQKSGESDGSDNIALKVYPVTPGIHDKVNINGNSISLMDYIGGIYASLTSIESLMGTNVELNRIIAAASGTKTSTDNSVTVSDTFPSNLDSILRGE